MRTRPDLSNSSSEINSFIVTPVEKVTRVPGVVDLISSEEEEDDDDQIIEQDDERTVIELPRTEDFDYQHCSSDGDGGRDDDDDSDELSEVLL